MGSKFAKWHAFAERNMRGMMIAPGAGALWSGLHRKGFLRPDGKEERGADRARKLAMNRGLKTLESTHFGRQLDQGSAQQELKEDFGSWDREKEFWRMISRGFATRLSGHVSILLGEGSAKLKLLTEGAEPIGAGSGGAGAETMIPAFKDATTGKNHYMLKGQLESVQDKILFDEIMDLDIAVPLTRSGTVTSISVTEFNDMDEPVSTYMMPLSQANN